MAEEGDWVWAKSGKPITYKNWQPGSPDNGSTPLQIVATCNIYIYIIN
jgi:hypothetical protein